MTMNADNDEKLHVANITKAMAYLLRARLYLYLCLLSLVLNYFDYEVISWIADFKLLVFLIILLVVETYLGRAYLVLKKWRGQLS